MEIRINKMSHKLSYLTVSQALRIVREVALRKQMYEAVAVAFFLSGTWLRKD